MNPQASQMVLFAASEFLRRHAPFDQMEATALRFLAERLKLAYYAKDTQIISPATGIVDTLRILQRGKVQAGQSANFGVDFGANSSTNSSALDYSTTLVTGEIFPVGALSARRSSTRVYIALDDVFCYELPAQDFFELMQTSTVFNGFCTERLARLLSRSQQQLQLQFAERAAEQQTMNSPLLSMLDKAPLTVSPETPIRRVVEAMASQRVGSMVIVDDAGKPLGIFTQSDVLQRIVLPGAALDGPISSVMTPSPLTLPIGANAYDAALAMTMRGVRHVLAVNEAGCLQGVIAERDLFSLQGLALRQIRQAIDSAANLDSLRRAASDVRKLASKLLAQGIGAEQLIQFIAALNDALTRRVIQLNLDRHDLYGIDWAWLSFGSEGRDEPTFSSDQDNGIVYLCTDMMDREQIQLRLLDFARDVNKDLDKIGFSLCQGNIMASNPELCLTLEEWENKITDWLRIPDPHALLNSAIFFDFRPLYGMQHLAHRLRLTLFRQVRSNPLFMRLMTQNALTIQAPLGRIRDFITDTDPERPGTIDLKKFGARLFIDAARIFALANGVDSTNTVHRLTLASAKMNIAPGDLAPIIEGFNFIQLLRLRHQHKEQAHGRAGGNYLNPDHLNALERRTLKASLCQARSLQQRLKHDYQT